MTLSEWIDILLEIENRGYGNVTVTGDNTGGDPYIYADAETNPETKEKELGFFVG